MLTTPNSGLKKKTNKHLTILRKLSTETTPAVQCLEGDTGACILCECSACWLCDPRQFCDQGFSSIARFLLRENSLSSLRLFSPPSFFLQQFKKKNKPSQAERLARLTLGKPVKWTFSGVPLSFLLPCHTWGLLFLLLIL